MPDRLREITTDNFLQEVLNPARLAALRRLGLLDTPAEAAFDRLGNLAAKLLHAPVALVSLVDDDRQFFKSCIGLPEPWNTWRDTPLSHSFCKHIVATAEPLLVTDARVDPVFRNNLAIRDLGVVAYLGIPLRTTDNQVLGSLCVIDSKPRNWTPDEVATVTVLAGCVMTEIELRLEMERRKKAEQDLSETNDALRSFSDMVSHDLRAPLRHIQSFAALLDESRMARSDEDRHCLEAIQVSARDASAMIDGLAALASVNRRPLEFTEVSVTEVARSAVDHLRASEPQQVEVVIDDGMRAWGDQRLLQLLLANLVGNAWKFSARASAPRVEIGSGAADGETIFHVRDNGIGFSKSEAELLFTHFGRLPSARDYAGSGLGLRTAQRIIDRHGGRIWAQSEDGGGATFFFVIPPQRIGNGEAAGDTRPAPAHLESHRN